MIKLGSPGFFLNLTKFVQEVTGRYIIVMVNSLSPLLCFSYLQILEKASIELYILKI